MAVRNRPSRPLIAGPRPSGQALVGTLRRGARRAVVATASMMLPAAVLVLPTAGTAAAAPPQPTTVTFTTPGETAFTVPAGVTSVSITTTGAAGQNGSAPVSLGAAGATVSGTVTVPTGVTTLYVNVNTGGGSGGTGVFGTAGAGGGASDVRTCSASAPGCVLTGVPGTDPRLIVAGGGGGGGASLDVHGPGGAGGSAGDVGQQGLARAQGGAGGGGGTATTGGAGGVTCSFFAADDGGDGSEGTGGTGGVGGATGGGGGAGWFGGGGGGGCNGLKTDQTNFYGGSGGGGGGSNRLPAGGTSGPATGPASVSITYTLVDTTPPAAPVITTPGDGSTLGDSTPAFAGTGEAGSKVTVTDAGSTVCTATVDKVGKWACTPGTALVEGEHTITATATDEAGNTSRGGPITITIAPTTPVITAPVDGSILRRCSERGRDAGERAGRGGCLLAFTGTGGAGDTVTVTEGSKQICSATVNDAGNWSCTGRTGRTSGEHTFIAIATGSTGAIATSEPVTVELRHRPSMEWLHRTLTTTAPGARESGVMTKQIP
ncbi:Ig-like domain-containing protein [Streptomyces sp. NPDC005148]